MKAILIIVAAYMIEGGLHTQRIDYPTMDACQRAAAQVPHYLKALSYDQKVVRVHAFCIDSV